MITVIIECRHESEDLAKTLAALVAGAVEGVIRDVVIFMPEDDPDTLAVAEAAGCRVARESLAEAIGAGRGDWLLVLEPGARPLAGWLEALEAHLSKGGGPARFRSALPIWQRVMRLWKNSPLACGLLIRRQEVLAQAARAKRLADLVPSGRLVMLDCTLSPPDHDREKR